MMAAIIANSTCTSTPAVADGTMPTTTIAVSTSCVSPTLFKALRRVIGIRVLRVDDETPSISCAIRAREGADVAANISRPAFERSPADRILGRPRMGRTRRIWQTDYG